MIRSPARATSLVRRLVRGRRPIDYETLYDDLSATNLDDAEIVGGGDFEYFGRVELAALIECGLKATDTLVDFGCGTGRLAVQVVPFLRGGEYIGVEITKPVLRRAERNVARAHPDPPCRITWMHNTDPVLPLADESADVICAFSVFTHMEHEDAYRYLTDGLRVVRPNGRFVFSCLPLDLDAAKAIFRASAELSVVERWRTVRNVATSRDFMNAIASLAGWRVLKWYGGDEHAFGGNALGQSVCVLQRS